MSTPLLILSDAPTAGTGLGRITGDLAIRIATHLPEFSVATLGYGGPYSSKLPYHQYQLAMHEWVANNLPEVWYDFAGDKKGICLTIWDASRMLWFSRPENCENQELRAFLTKPPFEKWGYFPMDAVGINGKLTAILKHIIEGYDRVLAYSQWAEDILRNTLTKTPLLDGLTNLPHGIDTTVFYPRNRTVARHGFGERIGAKTSKGKFFSVPDDALMIGIVATNQTRKDWGLGLSVVAELAKTRPIALWMHTDILERAWSIPALINDLGLIEYRDRIVVTTAQMTDEHMAWSYSACDLTLGIGLGEGFGFPIFESLACGVPCLHTSYSGAAEHMPEHMIVEEYGQQARIEGPYNCLRPIHDPQTWVFHADNVLNKSIEREPVTLPAHLDWNNLWPRWAEWLKAGI